MYRKQLFRVGTVLLIVCSFLAWVGSDQTPHRVQATSPIQHIVFIDKENRTFDSYFGLFPGANGTTTGKVKVNGVVKTITLNVAPDKALNYCHGWNCAHGAYDKGQNDNFAAADASKQCNTSPYTCYQEAQQSLIPNYWKLAQNFVLSDNTFSSALTASLTNHLFTAAGNGGSTTLAKEIINNPSNGSTNNKWGCDAPSGTTVQLEDGTKEFPCVTDTTLADEMQTANVSFKWYGAPTTDSGYKWDSLDTFKQDRNGTVWSHNVPWTQMATDLTNNALPAFSWVTPPFAQSEHAPQSVCVGENWSAQIIQNIENSSAWSSTVIIVAWDDWGGFYDHVPPQQLDGMGYGFRVPMIIISPFAFANDNPTQPHITHAQYELASVLKLAEEVFNLPSLGQRDASAGDLMQALNFTVMNPTVPLTQRTCPTSATPQTSLDYND